MRTFQEKAAGKDNFAALEDGNSKELSDFLVKNKIKVQIRQVSVYVCIYVYWKKE